MAKRPCCRLYRRALKVAIPMVFGRLVASNEKGGPEGPPGETSGMVCPLENEVRHKLQRARVAREEPDLGSPLVVRPEVGIAWDQEIAADGGRAERGYVV